MDYIKIKSLNKIIYLKYCCDIEKDSYILEDGQVYFIYMNNKSLRCALEEYKESDFSFLCSRVCGLRQEINEILEESR